jgi:transposase
MRTARVPGESVEVHRAGDPMACADPVGGEPRKAWVFTAALPYSAYAYAEAFSDMRLPAWIEAHAHAFEFSGGAARLPTPDNLRAGVVKSDRYEPALNPAHARMAEHYRTATIPARVKRPRDKPVIGEVKNVRYQHLSHQLKDYLAYAQATGRQFHLYVRQSTRFSRPLQDLIDSGAIIRIPSLGP